MYNRFSNMKRKLGFTLIEILIVIAIMGILTVITVSQFTTAKVKARDVARKSDLNTVAKALNTFFADYGRFPKIGDGDNIDIYNLMFNNDEFKDSSGYSYVKVMPRENGKNLLPFCYVVTDDQKKFALFSALENENDINYGKYIIDCPGNGGVGVTYNYAIVSSNANVLEFTAVP